MSSEKQLNTGFKCRLYPTKEQEKELLNQMYISRAVYNFARHLNIEEFRVWKKVKEEFVKTLSDDLSEKERKDKITAFNKKEYKNYISSHSTLYSKFVEETKEGGSHAWVTNADSLNINNTLYFAYDSAMDTFRKNMSNGTTDKIVKERMAKNKKKVDELRKKGEQKEYKKFNYPEDYGFPQYKPRGEATSYTTVIPVTSLDYERHKVKLPKIGSIRCNPNQPFPDFTLPEKKLYKTCISTDGVHFYLSFSYYKENVDLDTKDNDPIGVDLALKTNVAVFSDGTTIRNVAEDKKIVDLLKKLKRLQQQLSKLLLRSNNGYAIYKEIYDKIFKDIDVSTLSQKERNKLERKVNCEFHKALGKVTSRKIRTLKIRIRKTYNSINNYKNSFYHEECEHLIKEKRPSEIILEDLQIKNMQKNKKLSGKLQKTGMYKFKSTLVNHAKKHNIECSEVNTFYPSSQTCSNCGYIDKSMKDLSKRTFVCPNCGMVMDRDVNAATNLKNMSKSGKTKRI